MSRAQEASQREERNDELRALLTVIEEAYAVKEPVTDADGKIVDWRYVDFNLAFARQMGISDPIGTTVRELVPDIEPIWIDRYIEVLRTGQPIRFCDRMQRLGKILDVFAWRTGSGPGHRVALVFTDITARAEAEESLRKREERLRLILENARDYAIFSMDLQRRITSWHRGAEAILQYVEAEAVGKCGDMIFTEEDEAKGAPAQEAETALRDGQAVDERWHVRKGGNRFWSSGMLMVMRGASGEPVGFVKILRDQTDAKWQQEALAESRCELEAALKEMQRAREEAEASNRVKDRFMAILSHELRTPLTPVLMAAESLLKRQDLPPIAKEGLQMICHNIELETRLIDELLDLTRISRGKFELKREPLSLHDVIGRALVICRPQIDGKEQRLTLSLAAAPDQLMADSHRLQQVFWNVFQNSSKFTPVGGEIRVSTRNERDAIMIRIEDTGCGIPAAALPGLFEPFRQANETISREFGGLGLGLAISKGIVDAHGGEIVGESEGVNRGAVFIIRLPAAQGGKAGS